MNLEETIEIILLLGGQIFIVCLMCACFTIPPFAIIIWGLSFASSTIKSERERLNQTLEPDLNLKDAHTCIVCHTPRTRLSLRRCVECGQLFCYSTSEFTKWVSPQEKWDKIATKWAWIIGIFLTAFTILGGFIALGILAIPYMIFRSRLPGPESLPAYWKKCGGYYHSNSREKLSGNRCNNCGGASSVGNVGYSSSKYTPIITHDNNYEGNSYSNESYEQDYSTPNITYSDYDKDDDRNKDDNGSIWDGWLFKWDD